MIETIILVICSANLVLSVYGLFRKPKTVAGSVAIQPAVPVLPNRLWLLSVLSVAVRLRAMNPRKMGL